MLTIDFFVDPFKAYGVFQADAPRLGRHNEAKAADEEDSPLEDRFLFEACQFPNQRF
jgi:hypothetical protein